jgi:hypothetical protein
LTGLTATATVRPPHFTLGWNCATGIAALGMGVGEVSGFGLKGIPREALLPQPDTPIMNASDHSTTPIAAQRLENRLQLESRGTLLLSGRGNNEARFIAVPPSKFVLWGPGGCGSGAATKTATGTFNTTPLAEAVPRTGALLESQTVISQREQPRTVIGKNVVFPTKGRHSEFCSQRVGHSRKKDGKMYVPALLTFVILPCRCRQAPSTCRGTSLPTLTLTALGTGTEPQIKPLSDHVHQAFPASRISVFQFRRNLD